MSPIETPELLLAISSFLEGRDHARCCGVNRTWHEIFMPLVWSSTNSTTKHPTFEGLARHSHLVKEIVMRDGTQYEYSGIYFPKLTAIQYSRVFSPWTVAILTAHVSTLVQVTIQDVTFDSSGSFWTKMCELVNLRSVTLKHVSLPHGSVQPFKETCERLESLTLIQVDIVGGFPSKPSLSTSSSTPTLTSSLPPPSLSTITVANNSVSSTAQMTMKMLSYRKVSGLTPKEHLEWIAEFPGITHLACEGSEGSQSGEVFAELFAEYLEKGWWPQLKSISLSKSNISDESLSDILTSIKELRDLNARETGFGPRSFKELEPSLEFSLRTLDIRDCSGIDEDATGRMAQRILDSCNTLKEFKCGRVSANVFLKSGPWTGCSNSLEILRICFNFLPSESTVSNVESASTLDQVAINGVEDANVVDYADLHGFIFGRLSMLTQLRQADFGDEQQNVHGLDFLLSHGMGQLATLKRLKQLRLKNTIQQMGEEEVEWILEHWRVLVSYIPEMNRDIEP
ncbi:hypothetical protein BGX26_011725, partial [Mortierella sp. AD094]